MAETRLRKFVVRIDLRDVGGTTEEERTNNCLAKVNSSLATARWEWQKDTNNSLLVLKFKFVKFLDRFAIYEAREETKPK